MDELIDQVDPIEYLGRFGGRANSAIGKVPEASALTASLKELREQGGLIQYKITTPQHSNIKLLVYDDYNAWKSVSSNSKSPCWMYTKGANLVIKLTESGSKSSENYMSWNTLNGSGLDAQASGAVAFRKDGWAVIALAACETSLGCQSASGISCQGSIVAHASFEMTNGANFDGQFGLEDYGIFWCALVFFILQILLFSFFLFTRAVLARLRKFHPALRFLMGAIVFQLIALLIATIYWLIVGARGMKVQALFIFYTYLTAISNYLIIILLIFLGKGLTISRSAISPQGTLKIVAYATIFLACIIFAEAFASWGFDSTTGLYLYASSSGILLLTLRCVVALFWFIGTGYNQLKTFVKKRRFYHKFLVVFGAWLAAPFPLVLISINIKPIQQTIFSFIWEELLTLGAQVALVFMYSPDLACINATFPFHLNVDVGDSLFFNSVSGSPILAAPASNNKNKNKNKPPRATKNVSELYTDIRANAMGISETIRRLSRVEEKFHELIEDWITDVGQEEDDE